MWSHGVETESLGRLALLQGADPAALEKAARHARCRSCEPGTVLIDFGELSDDVYFLLEGAARVVARTGEGYEMILGDLSPGEAFGELAAITGQPRSANVTALHRSRFCVLPGPAFMELVLASPAVSLRMMRYLADLVRSRSERLFELAALPVRQRLYAELLRLSRGRGTPGQTAERVVSPPPPHHVLAARIGARREAVSRQLSDMEKAGLIDASRSGIVLRRPEAMRAELDAALRGAERAVNALNLS
ncbi:Catabolite gene activator [Roseomonas mucosa]|nr:Catabolite gene activator [Roseomonas mucosa]